MKPGPKPKSEKNIEDKKNTSTLTPEESAIFQRVQAEGDDWKTITEGDVEDFSLMQYPFQLPPEAQKLLDEKKFAFRYAEMKPARIDMLRNASVPMKWWICNAITMPELKKYCDPIHGGIQELDQLLMFKPYWMYEKVLAATHELADIQDKGGDLKMKDGEVDEDRGFEYHAGPKVKITGKDDIQDPKNPDGTSVLDEYYKTESRQESSSDLGDLVVE